MDTEAAYIRLALDEQRFLRERQILLGELDIVDSELVGALEGEPGDASDAGASILEREKDVGLVQDIDAALAEIAEARRRIERGTFGLCEACRKPIAEQRLEAVPATRFCIADAQQRERPLGGVVL
jgi:RNA polymerase-binding transcription factor DksA